MVIQQSIFDYTLNMFYEKMWFISCCSFIQIRQRPSVYMLLSSILMLRWYCIIKIYTIIRESAAYLIQLIYRECAVDNSYILNSLSIILCSATETFMEDLKSLQPYNMSNKLQHDYMLWIGLLTLATAKECLGLYIYIYISPGFPLWSWDMDSVLAK